MPSCGAGGEKSGLEAPLGRFRSVPLLPESSAILATNPPIQVKQNCFLPIPEFPDPIDFPWKTQ